MMSLEELAKKYGSDKFVHGFCPCYESVLSDIRHQYINMLEIGVDHGWSLRMWKDYFPNATIHGVDVVTNLHGMENVDNVHVNYVDCDDITQIEKFVTEHGKFDLIIDDGGHSMRQQQNALRACWPSLKQGGIFIMEDLHTSLYEFYPKRNPGKQPTTLQLIESLGSSTATFSSSFIPEDQFLTIKDQIHEAQIFRTVEPGVHQPAPSITSIIRKK